MLKYSGNTINEWNFGDDNIVKVYRGVKGKPKHNYEEDYLTLVAETDNVSFSYSTATSSNKLKYSLDSGETWSELGNNQSTSAINSGEKILFKASGLTVNTERGIGKIIPSASASVEGNIMSLAYGDNFSGQTVIPNNYQFRKLFSGVTSITSAENMALPATTVKKQCYSQMFQACTNLTKTPKVIGSSAMTWSGDYCFSDMFNSCTSLTTVPSGLLPAKNLSSACYWCFFQNCSNLTNTPLLPATTLVSNCYYLMFQACTNLNHIEALFTTTPSSSYMRDWVSGVTNSGTFYKNSEATWTSSCGTSTYPCNWTVENYVPSDNQEEESSDYVGVVVYYKVITSGDTPEYKVCFAVVDDISQYSEREFEDVYDNATEKWYKLNNLNQYEEYGIYGSGRTICEGSSRLPQGYTEVEYIENTSTAYINTEVLLYDSTTNSYEIETKMSSTWGGGEFEYLLATEGTSSPYNGLELRWNTHYQSGGELQCESVPKNVAYSNVDNGDGTSAITISCTSTNATNNVPLSLFCGIWSTGPWRNGRGKIYSFKVTKNDTLVRDLVPCKRDSDDKYGMYDLITDTFYVSPNNVDFSGGEPITPTDCVTTYNGKLTIDGDYEYEWNGSSWVNVGEVSGSSRVPSGYVELTHAQTIKQAVQMQSGFTVPIDLQATYNYIFEFTPIDWESNTGSYYGALLGGHDGDTNYPSYGLFKLDNGWGTMWYRTISTFWNYSFDARSGKPASGKYRFYDGTKAKLTMHLHNYDASQGADMIVENEGYPTSAVTSTSTYRSGYVVATGVYNLPLFSSINRTQDTAYMNFYNLKIETNENVAVYDYIPCKRKSDNKVGLYDVVHNVFYAPLFELNAGDEASHTEYPKYYTEKSDPLNDLTFNTMEDAQAYAYNNCVYDGMKATIDGDRYYFDSSDENGWVKILEYYKVEDVTPSGGSGWTISGSATYNPDSTYYDDFDLETTSTSNVTKIAKVTIYGYDHFTYYLRSYHGYSGAHGYVMSTNVDEIQAPPASMSYDSSSAITTTYYWNKSPKSAVNLSNYRRVTYNNLDKTVEHTFYVYFYGRTYSSYVGNATILIPKEQTNENWEQVTFSASSNVASIQKNLYIDGNYSTSGGTQYWYYRWIVGLPSGSHSSYTNYSNYNYCPNITSSTFTSVAGEQRQVNFTYDNTASKNLSFRLTDGSNVLTPSNSVYYGMTLYNSCGVSVSTVLTFPIISFGVKVGGSFSFSNSSNRHYIYGYQPPTLGTRYYVDNYSSTFDIVYTKLSDEAVTITYTTYDPSDVEIPAFNTDITYPYNGGTTSSTTLTSFDVPYTYPYTVKQTNDKFSADSQSYTANQTSRTINFVLYPNNREFATVADMEAYQYAWEGMKATVGDTKYQYKNGEWVENQHSLPDVPFVLNYNARQYNASTYTIPYTEGALNAIDAVITGTTANIIDHSSDGYIELTGSTSTPIRALVGTANFSRSNSTPNITIICKAYTPGSSTEGNILSNRKESYNWMYRHKSNLLKFHGTSEQGSIAVSNTEPNTCSVRIDSSRLLRYNNWSQNTTSTYSNFNYGSNSNGGALFSGYYASSGEHWKGVFYWIYMSLNTLTDEQVQQVIDYNENL